MNRGGDHLFPGRFSRWPVAPSDDNPDMKLPSADGPGAGGATDAPASWREPGVRDAMLNGIPNGPRKWKGGHLWPGRPGNPGAKPRTVWPEGMDGDEAMAAIEETRADPDWVWTRKSGDVMHIRDVDGVRVRTAHHPAEGDLPETPIHGYPASGSGVTQLDENGVRTPKADHDPVDPRYTWTRDHDAEPPRDG